MGKGARNRQSGDKNRQAYQRLMTEEQRLHRYTVFFAVTSAVLLLIAMAVQVFAILSITSAEQTPEALELLNRGVPMGILAVVLMTVGTLLAAVLLCLRRWKLSLIGVASVLIGAAFLAAFTAILAECFPFREIITGTTVREQGLNFNKLFLRHGTAFFPPVLLLASVGFAFASQKKRDIAEVLSPDKDVSTLSLDD